MRENELPAKAPSGSGFRFIAPATLAAVAAGVLHVVTIIRIRSWSPGYPWKYALSPFTPPEAMQQLLHSLGPVILVGLLLLVVLARVRSRGRARPKWVSPVLWSSGVVLGILLLGYSWALLWVTNASRYVG